MEHEHDDRSISQTSRLCYSRHESLLFLIIEMTWSGSFFH